MNIKKIALIIGSIIILSATIWFTIKVFNESTTPTAAIGYTAPLFEIENPNGSVIKLEDFKGDIVLVDVWASWCAPCRKTNPKLVELYQNYHDANFTGADNFEIISISLDDNKSAWQYAIDKDNLFWDNHACDLKRDLSPIIELYDINEIPANFLIDANGMVVGKDYAPYKLSKQLDKMIE